MAMEAILEEIENHYPEGSPDRIFIMELKTNVKIKKKET